jgi:uncharacterized LabA/DUF88 family protein
MTQITAQTAQKKFSAENIAFIDGQNLHLGTQSENWEIDHDKFRVYLREKYKVKIAYYFLGYLTENQQYLYEKLQEAGFVIIFREHREEFRGKKKGNVDTDIVFEIMKSLIEKTFGKIILVSGDGDYKKTVDYLIKKEKFAKILFPNKNYSSLYKQLGNEFCVNLGKADVRINFEYKKEKGG